MAPIGHIGASGAPPIRFQLDLVLPTQGSSATAYNVGDALQKIKLYFGTSIESSVVLDYNDPTVLIGRS
jgi:hypothetical protein